jgi:hypothetical protein
MIGYYIEGTDLKGQKCAGLVHDKVSILQSAAVPSGDGTNRVGFFPLDAYLVYAGLTHSIHFVSPGQITNIILPIKA